MIIYHVTNKCNLKSIMSTGLDPAYAVNKREAVWGVSHSLIGWAISHTLAKPRDAESTTNDLVILQVNVPRSWVKKYRRRIYYVPRLIQPGRIEIFAEAGSWAMAYPE